MSYGRESYVAKDEGRRSDLVDIAAEKRGDVSAIPAECVVKIRKLK